MIDTHSDLLFKWNYSASNKKCLEFICYLTLEHFKQVKMIIITIPLKFQSLIV